jgi:glycosyltransferase involved in cell wall biosynthesis
MSKVDVILTSYNRPKMVTKAIKSVLTQTMEDFTLWIMDDNSDDETQEILHKFANSDDRIKLIISTTTLEERLLKVRYADMINIALVEGYSNYITYLTDDCYYRNIKLEVMSNYLDRNPEIGICYGNQQIINSPPWYGVNFRGNYGTVSDPFCWLDHNQIMHRRYLVNIVGLWDTEFPTAEDRELAVAKDADYFRRLIKVAGPIEPVDYTTDVFVFHDNMYTDYIRHGKEKELGTKRME